MKNSIDKITLTYNQETSTYEMDTYCTRNGKSVKDCIDVAPEVIEQYRNDLDTIFLARVADISKALGITMSNRKMKKIERVVDITQDITK